MENSQSILSPSSSLLLCKENSASFYAEDEQALVNDYDEEYIKVLLDKETEKRGLQPQDLLKNSWMQARLGGINYILRKREVLGFGFRTAFVSVSYLDRFLSIRDVDKPWAIRLMSMACLSLAAKMEERRVPALSEFSEDLYFASSTIKRMELLVLQTLEWEMGAITPFDFIHFFADKLLDKSSVSANAVSKSVQLILDTMRDAKIMCNRPSVIAAAATLFVLDQGLTREAVEMKISPLNSTHHFSIESIISCYGLFQEIERLKLSKSPPSSPMQLPYGSSSVSSAKRKRLEFKQETDSK